MAIQIPDSARCLVCGYLLRGLPRPICPECGTTFDPDNPETYNEPNRPRDYQIRPLPAPEISYLVFLCLIAAILIGLRATVPGIFFGPPFGLQEDAACVAIPLLLFVLIPYFSYWIRLRTRRELGLPELLQEFERHQGRWRAINICIVVLLITLVYPWPACVRFYVSWPWFAARAKTFLQNPPANRGPQNVGLWRIERIWGRGQGFVFFQSFTGAHDGGTRYGIVRYDVNPAMTSSGMQRQRVWIAPSWYFEAW